jgi:hypothetical protein
MNREYFYKQEMRRFIAVIVVIGDNILIELLDIMHSIRVILVMLLFVHKVDSNFVHEYVKP